MMVARCDVVIVNIKIRRNVDTVNTWLYHEGMPRKTATDSRKTASRPYHHGDLPRAMLREAVRTIQSQGIEALTLRSVGERLGVSRTALYRHFTDKQALLAAVAAEGFRTLRAALLEAWESAGRGRKGFRAMGTAYVRFAITHPSHYRVMFGGGVHPGKGSAHEGPGTDAFQVLVDAIVAQQKAGLMRADEPRQLALYIWAVVHGVAMLALDGMLPAHVTADALIAFANARMETGTSE
jgi:AcrR family transcriptional regulator